MKYWALDSLELCMEVRPVFFAYWFCCGFISTAMFTDTDHWHCILS